MFAGMLKLNKARKEVKEKVDQLIEELRLTNCRKT